MATIAATAPRARRIRRALGRHPVGLLFVLPYAAFLVLVYAYPLGLAVYMSFYDYFFAAPGAVVERPFVGFDNYTTAFGDPIFLESLGNVVTFLVINVPLTVAFSLVLATALNAKLPLRGFFRTAYYIPYVTASVAVIGVWLWLFSDTGLVNSALGPVAPAPPWLVNEFWAMPMIALFATWKQLGFYVVLYLAALQNIPSDLYDAASVDGAGALKSFRHVTVPGVRPATTLVVILSTIVGANFFTEPYLLTGGGGPNNSSVSPVLHMYRRGIEQGDAGYAAAIGVLLAIGVIVISMVNRFILERD